MKKNYFLLEDFNAFKKYLETLQSELKELGKQMQEQSHKGSVMGGDTMANGISEQYEQSQEKIDRLNKLLVDAQIIRPLTDATHVGIGLYVQIRNCTDNKLTWYQIRGCWFEPQDGRSGATIETAIPIANTSPLILACIGKSASSTLLVRQPGFSFYYIVIEQISTGELAKQTQQ